MDGEETPREAIIREAFEEIWIDVRVEDLLCIWVEYCKSDTERINIYFTTKTWIWVPYNKEPHKHDALERFSLHNLPDMMDYPKQFIEEVYLKGSIYKETHIDV